MSKVLDLAKKLVTDTQTGAYNKYVYSYGFQPGPAEPAHPPDEHMLYHDLKDLPQPLVIPHKNKLGWSTSGRHYSWKHGFPLIGYAGEAGELVSLSDCSGFTAYIIQQLAPQLYDTFCGEPGGDHGQPWPSAAAYTSPHPEVFDLIGNETDQTSLADALAKGLVQPGDFQAWSSPLSHGDTGHVMVIAATPSLVPGTSNAWYVPVYDCSGTHLNDTRADHTHAINGSGLGHGTVIISHVQNDQQAHWYVSFGGHPAQPSTTTSNSGGSTTIRDTSANPPPPEPPTPLTLHMDGTDYVFYYAPHLAVQRLKI